MRLRLTVRPWPSPRLVLTDTPRPRCPHCRGEGGWSEDYGDAIGEYAGTEAVLCGCWDPERRWTLLVLPRALARRRRDRVGYSDVPPF